MDGKIIVEQKNNVSKKMQITTSFFHELECQKAEVFQSTIRPEYSTTLMKYITLLELFFQLKRKSFNMI